MSASSAWICEFAAAKITLQPHRIVIEAGRRTDQAERANRQGDVDGPADLDAEKVLRGDADDRHRRFFDRHRSADHVGRATETALPQSVADDRDRTHRPAAELIVGHRERPSDQRGDAQRLVVIAADEAVVDDLGRAVRPGVAASDRRGTRP